MPHKVNAVFQANPIFAKNTSNSVFHQKSLGAINSHFNTEHISKNKANYSQNSSGSKLPTDPPIYNIKSNDESQIDN